MTNSSRPSAGAVLAVAASIATIVGLVIAIIALVKPDSGSRSDPPPPATASAPAASVSGPSASAAPSEQPSAGPSAASNATPTPAGSSPTGSTAHAAATHKVRLAVLCNGGDDSYICGTGYGGTAEIGHHLFTYAGETNPNADTRPPNWDTFLAFPATSCMKLHLRFATDGDDTAHFRLVQSRRDIVSRSSGPSHVERLDADLDGGPFSLEGSTDEGGSVYANGYALCRTDSGKR